MESMSIQPPPPAPAAERVASLFHVEAHLVPALWERLAPGLVESIAESEGYVSLEQVRQNLATGHWLLWVSQVDAKMAGFTVTEFHQTARGAYLNLLFTWIDPGARGVAWQQGIERLEGFARSLGLAGIKFYSSRRGYEKRAPAFGYRRGLVEWVKEF
jgi:hypothetical protein